MALYKVLVAPCDMELINMTDHHGNDGRSLGSMVIGLGHGTGKLAHSMRMAQRVRHKYKNKQTVSPTPSFLPTKSSLE